jgi:hypothetical protein
MPESRASPLRCADCGRDILGEPIVISPAEQLCQDCWPFFLKPIPGSDKEPPGAQPEPVTHSD